MDLSMLAEALGVGKDAPQEQILSSAAKAVADGIAARESLNRFTSQLGSLGLRLEGEKLSRVVAPEALSADDAVIQEGDSDQVKRLKEKLAAAGFSTAKASLEGNKKLLEQLTKEGRIPPAGIQALEALLGMRDQGEVLSLSSDGKQVLARVENVKEKLVTFLTSLPKFANLDKSKLTQLAAEVKDPNAPKDPQALSKKGSSIAARVSANSKTRKEEKAVAGKK